MMYCIGGKVSSGQYTQMANAESGIAIGPILFIIAILAILAAAIAAGSGGFSAGSAGEKNRTYAAALIEVGQGLKVGMDRLVVDNSIDIPSVVINPAKTANSNELFSPTGGGIGPPATSLAGAPGGDAWAYVYVPFTGVGNSSNNQTIAMLNITQAVCAEVNNKVIGSTDTTQSAIVASNILAVANGTALTIPATLQGKAVGCLNNTTAPNNVFYQIIGVQ